MDDFLLPTNINLLEDESLNNLRKLSPKERKRLEDDNRTEIRYVYTFAIIVWIIIIFYFKIYETDAVGILLISLVLAVFIINWRNAKLNIIYPAAFGANFLSLAFLLAVIIRWEVVMSIEKISTILFLGVIFLIISLIEVQIESDNPDLNKHVRIIIHTYSVGLFAIGIYLYYREGRKFLRSGGKIPSDNNKFTEFRRTETAIEGIL